MILSWPDLLALAFYIVSWVGYAHFTEQARQHERSLLNVTNGYRQRWMRELIRRDNRSMDVIMIGNLQRSIAFFANTSIFIALGLIGMLGIHDRAADIISAIPFSSPLTPFQWELKIALLILVFIYAFFKYTWSMRQYNYAGIFVSSMLPHDEADEAYLELNAAKGGFLISNAAKHFNNGLRAYYFGLAALAWFVNPYFFIAITALVVFVTHRREYHSTTLANLSR